MIWTIHDLADAVAKLPQPVTDLVAACDTLNAQTVTLTSQTIRWADVKAIARESPAGDWSKIVLRARQTQLSGTSQAADTALLVAINADAANDADQIDPTNQLQWAAFIAGLDVLQAIGDVSADTEAAIKALPTITRPAWTPPVTVGHIQTAIRS